jgi:hypothetical protein
MFLLWNTLLLLAAVGVLVAVGVLGAFLQAQQHQLPQVLHTQLPLALVGLYKIKEQAARRLEQILQLLVAYYH